MIASAALVVGLALGVLALLWQAGRARADLATGRPDIALVRQAQADLDVSIARGEISEADARSEQADLRRRALAVARLDDKQSPLKPGPIGAEFAVAAAVVAIGAFGFVWLSEPPQEPPAQADQVPAPPRAGVSASDFDALMAAGQARFAERDFRGAFDAYAAAAQQKPKSPVPWLAQGEALLAAGLGEVSPAAMLAFAEAEVRSPGNPISQYYTGLERLQQGDAATARQIWTALKERSRPGAPWLPQVERGLDEAEKQLGISEAASEGSVGIEQIEAMVAGLAARLEEERDDPMGWLMLARSYLVLDRPDDARAALARLEALPSVPADVSEQAAQIASRLAAAD